MKNTLLLFFLFFIGFGASAQYYFNAPPVTPYGNPGNINTDFENPYGNGLAAGWVSIQPATSPAWSATQTLPFAFNFNGTAVTQYKVSTTGVLTFDLTAATAPNSGNNSLPNAGIPDKSICAWGIEYSGGNSNDHIVVKTFGVAPNRQHWIMYASYSIPMGGPQCFEYISIVLEESSNKIYIVDQRASSKPQCQLSLTIGIQVDATTAYQINGSPNIHSVAGTNETSTDNRYYEFIPGVRPSRDVAVNYIQTNNVQVKSSPVEIRGSIKSFGLNPVTSYRINYNINNGTVYRENIASTNIVMYGEEWYFHDSIWTPNANGIYTLKVWADLINGQLDENPYNDTMVKMVQVIGVFTPKIRLHEVFTNAQDPICKAADDTILKVLTPFTGQFALLKYQMPPDIYSTAEGQARAASYGADSVPDMIVNGQFRTYPNFYNAQQYNDFYAAAFLDYINLNLSRVGNKYTLSGAIIPYPDVDTSSNLVLYIALVEKVTHNNQSTSGATTFYNVMKKMLPNQNGTALAKFTPGMPVNFSQNYTFPTGHTIENLNNMQAIIFIQNKITKEILQTKYIDFPNSVGETEYSPILNMFPNPSNDIVFVNYQVAEKQNVKVELYNTLGELVYSKNEGEKIGGVYSTILETSNLAKGVYVMKLTIGEGGYSKKLIVE